MLNYLSIALIYLVSVVASQNSLAEPSQTPLQPCDLTFSWTVWPPYMDEQNGELTGYNIELLKWIRIETGCKIHMVKMSWSDGLKAIELGKADFISSAAKTEQRQKFAWFSIPYLNHVQVLTIRRGESEKYGYTTLNELLLHGFKLGLITNGYLGKDISAIEQDSRLVKNIIYFPNLTALLTGIADKKIDGMFIDPDTLDTLNNSKQLPIQLEEYHSEIILEVFHFMFSKKAVNNGFVKRFNKALKKIKQSKKYNAHVYWSTVK